MGWYFTCGASRKDIISERTENCKSARASSTCIAHCTRGNVLWAVWEQYRSDTGHIERFITCDLLQRDGNYGWGYKPMDESMHPYYYTCPEKYLNMGTRVFCQDWREGVRKYHNYRRICRAARSVHLPKYR